MKKNHYLNKMNSSDRISFINEHYKGSNKSNYGNKWSDEQKEHLSNLNKCKLLVVDSNIRMMKSNQTRGGNNPNAKEYIIMDSTGTVKYDGVGGFVDYLKDNSITIGATYTAIKNDTPMYHSKQAKTMAIKHGNDNFIG